MRQLSAEAAVLDPRHVHSLLHRLRETDFSDYRLADVAKLADALGLQIKPNQGGGEGRIPDLVWR